jgi:hypothetical protein
MAVISSELADALRRFKLLFDSAAIDARQTHGPATIYTPSVVVWLMVFQRLHGNATLESAVDELLRMTKELPAKQLPSNRRIEEETLSSNTAAYSQARTRFDVDVANDVADCVFGTLMAATPPSWQNRRVFIVDGTTSKLSSSDPLRLLYPPASNQHGAAVWPIMHWAVAHELSSGCAVRPEIGAMYGPRAVGEVELACGLLQRIPAKSVLMADRNFGVFAFYYPAKQAGYDLVTRLTEARFRSMVKKAKAAGPGRWRLLWKPTKADRKHHPELPADAAVRVVLHERKVTGPKGEQTTLWLATTLRSAEGESVVGLYKHRQDVESDIRDVKVALKMEELRGRSGDMISKELALGMVAYNLVVQVRRLAAKRIDVAPRRLSFTGVWSLVTTILLSPKDWTQEEYESTFEQVLRWAAQRKLPNRPGREFPRTVLPRGRKFPNRAREVDDLMPK